MGNMELPVCYRSCRRALKETSKWKCISQLLLCNKVPTNIAASKNTFTISVPVGQESRHDLAGWPASGTLTRLQFWCLWDNSLIRGSTGEGSASKLLQVVGRTHFPVAISLRSPASC